MRRDVLSSACPRRLGALAVAAALAALPAYPVAASARRPPTRGVLVVSNNWAGTADIIDLAALRKLKRLNVIPDRDQRLAEITADPTRKFYFDNVRKLAGEGHNQYVDDGFPSKDGRRIYFSRPSFADVVAINARSGRIVWRVPVDGYRSDHMALSPDGRRLLVSASTARTVDVIDTVRGRIVARIPSGDSPHESNFSRDGRRIFHASIGSVYTDMDDPALDATKGERVFQVIDAQTFRVLRRIDMGHELARWGLGASAAVRPMAISPDERYVYFELSFLHGFVEYDLRARRPTRVSLLPISPAARRLPRRSYLLDSAMHGLALNPNGTRFCVAATVSGYAAIVSRRTLRPIRRIIPVGRVPYWSTSSPNGRWCFVSVARSNRVAVISYRRARLARFIRVGFHPQRMRTGRLRVSALR
jgi:DNA-binding beta-propeller fold protein YncE